MNSECFLRAVEIGAHPKSYVKSRKSLRYATGYVVSNNKKFLGVPLFSDFFIGLKYVQAGCEVQRVTAPP